MKHTDPHAALLSGLLAGALIAATAATATTASAAAAATAGNGAQNTLVPELYAGELDDTGPQYLILESPAKPTRFTLWGRADLAETDNATYSEANPESSSLSSLQLGIDARCWSREVGKSVLRLDAGVRGQAYRYGLFGDHDKVIDYLEVNRNNFDLLGSHLRFSWQRGRWIAEAVTGATWMRSTSTDRTFYRELSQGLAVYRQWNLPAHMAFYAGADIGRRWTRTYSYGLMPASWNDRWEASLLAMLAVPIGRDFAWRNTVRVHGASYSHRARDRRDITGTFGTELTWQVWKGLELRVQLTHESRDTSETYLPDYHRWELGTGCAARWSF